MAKGSTGSDVGTGGMATKLTAAKIATLSGADMVIANGVDVCILHHILMMILQEQFLKPIRAKAFISQIL